MDSPIYTSRLSPLQNMSLLNKQEQVARDNDYLRRLALNREFLEEGYQDNLNRRTTDRLQLLQKIEPKIKQRLFRLRAKITNPEYSEHKKSLTKEALSTYLNYEQVRKELQALKAVAAGTKLAMRQEKPEVFDLKTDERVGSFLQEKVPKVFDSALHIEKGNRKLKNFEITLENLVHRLVPKDRCCSFLSTDSMVICGVSGKEYQPELESMHKVLKVLPKIKHVDDISSPRIVAELGAKNFEILVRWGLSMYDSSHKTNLAESLPVKEFKKKQGEILAGLVEVRTALDKRKVIIAPNADSGWLRPFAKNIGGIKPGLTLNQSDRSQLRRQIAAIDKARTEKEKQELAAKLPYAGVGRKNRVISHRSSHAAATDSHCAENSVLLTYMMVKGKLPDHVRLSSKQYSGKVEKDRRKAAKEREENSNNRLAKADLSQFGLPPGSPEHVKVASRVLSPQRISAPLCAACKHNVPRVFSLAHALKKTSVDTRAVSSYYDRKTVTNFRTLNPIST
ncbi:MAG: hypothetical protein WC860_01310 [Candidatus Margulisiibacteriota bacterium]|jgi:hypothetical protein